MDSLFATKTKKSSVQNCNSYKKKKTIKKSTKKFKIFTNIQNQLDSLKFKISNHYSTLDVTASHEEDHIESKK